MQTVGDKGEFSIDVRFNKPDSFLACMVVPDNLIEKSKFSILAKTLESKYGKTSNQKEKMTVTEMEGAQTFKTPTGNQAVIETKKDKRNRHRILIDISFRSDNEMRVKSFASTIKLALLQAFSESPNRKRFFEKCSEAIDKAVEDATKEKNEIEQKQQNPNKLSKSSV